MLHPRGSGLRLVRQLRAALARFRGRRSAGSNSLRSGIDICWEKDFVRLFQESDQQNSTLPGGKMKKYFVILLFAILALGLCLPPAFAQASGTVKGVCKDATGAPVADGVVVWANQDNGQKYTLKTNKKGEYFSLGLTPGKYNVTL